MSFVTHLRSGHWSHRRLAVNESASTCWLWPLIWATSTSTLPIGIYKPRPNFCVTSLSSPRTLCRQGGHDVPRTAHGGIPARTSGPPSWRQPTHLRLLRLHLPGAVRVRCPKAQNCAGGSDAGTVGRRAGQRIPGASGDQPAELRRDAKHPPGCYPVILPLSAASRARRSRAGSTCSGDFLSRRPTLVWYLISSRKKCRLCSTLLIHQLGQESEIAPCCTWRCAPASESQNSQACVSTMSHPRPR